MAKFAQTAAMIVGGIALGIATAGVGDALAAGLTLSAALSTAAAASVVGISAGALFAASAALEVTASLTAPKPKQAVSPMAWSADPEQGIPYPMGRCYVGGNIVYREAYGSDNKYQTLVTILGGAGPHQSIDTCYVDGVASAIGAGGVVDISDRGKMYAATQLGRTPELSGLTVAPTTPYQWTAACKLSGYAASIVTLVFDTKGGHTLTSTPQVGWVGHWVKVYDPRKDSTFPGGSGSHRAADETTWEWSQNPALHGITWLIGRRQNGKLVLGVGSPAAGIITSQFVEWANICDANSWKIGGTVYSTDDKWDVFGQICQAGGAEPLRLNAQVGVLVNTPRVSLATIEVGDVVGEATIQATQGRKNRINAVVPRYMAEQSVTTQNSDNKLVTTVTWSIVAGSPVVVADYVAFDGRQRQKEVEYSLVQDLTQSQQLARYDIENAREFGPIVLPLKLRWMGYKPGDVVTATLPELGLNGQDILLLNRTLSPKDGTVTMTARSETAGKHAFALGQTGTAPATPSISGPPLVPVPGESAWAITAETISANGTTRPALVISGSADSDVIDAVLFEYRESTGAQDDDDGWISAGSFQPGVTGCTIGTVKDGVAYQCAVSYRKGPATGTRLILGPAIAGQTAVPWQTGVTGTGKPEDGATNGAPSGTPFGDGTVDDYVSRMDDLADRQSQLEAEFASASPDGSSSSSAANALASANAAQQSAATAQTAQQNAEAARDAAKSAESQASSVLSDTAAARDAAVAAKTAAQTAQSGASTSATQASASKDSAAGSAAAAQSSATAAAQSAGQAGNSASAAAGSASTATTKAGAAGTSAAAAQTAQTAAESARDAASTAATAAAGSAASASTSATQAGQSANASQISAVEANAAADLASYLDVYAAYMFNGSAEGWTLQNGNLVANPATLFLSFPNNDPQFAHSGLSIDGSRFTKIVIDCQRTDMRKSGGWDGKVFYATSAHGGTASYYLQFPEGDLATLHQRTQIVLDMSQLTAGGSDWINSIITGLRIDFDQGPGGGLLIYSLRIVGPDAGAPAALATAAADSAQTAASSADAAGASAGAAQTAATTATTKAADASTSATAAATSASTAQSASTNAGSSASAAAQSATTANSQGQAAQTSATAAATSAQLASTKADAASSSATAAATSATSAATSKGQAATSATAAASAADSADDSASAAATSATAAKSSQAAAATSETNASSSAGSAASAATTATQKATAAAGSATSAQSYATAANGSMVGAQSAATLATQARDDVNAGISAQADVIADINQRTAAGYFKQQAWAGSTASATIRLYAEDSNGNETSDVSLLAQNINLYNPAGSGSTAYLKALSVSGGNVQIFGRLQAAVVETGMLVDHSVTKMVILSQSGVLQGDGTGSTFVPPSGSGGAGGGTTPGAPPTS